MKRNIYYFNSLLRIYNKYRRKLDNLRKANKNERRQGILQKHIERLYEKLNLLNSSIKQKTVMASIAMAAFAFVPQVADAQTQFAPKQINPFSLTGVDYNSTPTFADLDGDGDLDMLTGDFYRDYIYNGPYNYYYINENRFKYYQNIGTASNPLFAAPVVNPFGLTGNSNYNDEFTPIFVDLDGDGDMDIVHGLDNGQFYYLQNIGTATAPNFAAPVLNPFGLVDIGDYSDPTFADMDGDGDLDLLSGELYGSFFYFQNTGTSTAPSFAPPQPNPFGLTPLGSYSYSSPTFVDMDGDGDLDLLSGNEDGNFYYFQNTPVAGIPSFSAPTTNPLNLSRVGNSSYFANYSNPTFADLDNDGDKDLMAGDDYGDFNYYRRCVATTSTISPVSVCNYVSPSGIIKTTGGTFTDIIPNAAGCDSIITINLTINPILNQTLTPASSLICGGSGQTNIILGSSQNGVSYYLRDNSNNAVVTGPIAGTGSSISLSTGTINATTAFNVFGEKIVNSQGLNFDNSNDFVDAGSGVDVSNSSFSVEFWAKKSSLSSGSDDHIIGIGDNTTSNNALHIGFRGGSNNFTFAFFGNDLDANSSFTDLNWHHWAVTFDVVSKVRNIYRDGVLVAADVSSSNFTGTGTLRIGRAYLANYNYFNGSLDEVRIWNTVRSVGDINANKNSCLSGSESGLLAYYKFEDAIGSSTLTSATGNHNGTLQNMDVNNAWGVGANVCSTCNLQMSQVVTVTVSATPAPTISVNSGAICIGQSYTINPSGASTYTISGGNSVVSPTVQSSYTVTGTAADGCVANAPAIATVSVNALPVISVNSGSICSGQSFTINPSGASTYTISGGNTVVSPTVDATYNVTGTDANGCVSPVAAVSSVTVNSLPTISVNSGTICSGQTFTINPSGASTYTISGGNSVVSPTVDATYNVTGTDANGCVSASAAVSSVTVNASPVISVNSGAICIGQSFTINPSGASTYTISGGNTVVSPTVDATYNVTGTDADGCVSLTAAVSNVTVNALPTVLAVTNNTLLCVGETATLTASGATSYTWNTTANTAAIAVSPTVATSYTVTGTDANGCVNTATISQATSLCTGISSIENNRSDIFAYPNPTNGLVQITIPQELFGNTMVLTNTFGQAIESRIIDNTTMDYDLQNLATGIYFIQVKTSNGIITKKVIKN